MILNMSRLINLLPTHHKKIKITPIVRYTNFHDKVVQFKNSNNKLNSNKIFVKTIYYPKHQVLRTSQVFKEQKIQRKFTVTSMQIQLLVCLDIEFSLINRIKKRNNQNQMLYNFISRFTSLQKRLLKNL